MPADLELFIVLIILTFAEEFCGLAALDVHACYSAKGSINKYRNGLLNSSFCAVFVVLCLKQGSRTGNLCWVPSSGGASAFGSWVAKL